MPPAGRARVTFINLPLEIRRARCTSCTPSAREARGSLRLSLGRTTTDAELDQAVEIVPRVIADSRSGAAVLAADPLGQAVAT